MIHCVRLPMFCTTYSKQLNSYMLVGILYISRKLAAHRTLSWSEPNVYNMKRKKIKIKPHIDIITLLFHNVSRLYPIHSAYLCCNATHLRRHRHHQNHRHHHHRLLITVSIYMPSILSAEFAYHIPPRRPLLGRH